MVKQSQPTITMPKHILEAWLRDLRSGEYKQGAYFLATNHDCYCCLGVLACAIEGQRLTPSEMCARVGSNAHLTLEYLKKHAIHFFHPNDEYAPGEYAPAPFLSDIRMAASRANDSGEYTFEQIAYYIEQEYKRSQQEGESDGTD